MLLEVYLVIIVITCYFRPLEGAPPVGEVHLIHFTPSFVTTLPVQVFAFTCGQNVRHFFVDFGMVLMTTQIFPIYNELRTNSQRRVNTVIGTSIGGAIIIYEIISVFGYLTFGSNVGRGSIFATVFANCIACLRSVQTLLRCTLLPRCSLQLGNWRSSALLHSPIPCRCIHVATA